MDWERLVIFLVIKLVVLKFKIKINDKDKKKVRYSLLEMVLKMLERVRIYENLVISLESEFVLFIFEMRCMLF